jgi:dephospho-CoA kinase
METVHSIAKEIKNLLKGEDLLLIGLTGGIGTGKTVVAEILADLGATLIDFDGLSRKVVLPGKPAWKEIVQAFGEEVLLEDKSLDRKKLRGIVFQDASKRLILERATHPHIYRLFISRLREIATGDPHAIVLAIIPLLFECQLQPWFHKILLVFATRERQIQRLQARDGLSTDQAEDIVQAQMPIEGKKSLADLVIDNDGSLEKTMEATVALWSTLEAMQKKKFLRRGRDT